MSALGQKQTFCDAGTMSALPPKADMCGATRHVRFVPIADIGFLFDHVVGLRKQRCWDRYAERLSCLEIDHQLVLGWRLHGKIGGLLAFEDPIDVTRGTPVLVDKINAIGDQSAAGHSVLQSLVYLTT